MYLWFVNVITIEWINFLMSANNYRRQNDDNHVVSWIIINFYVREM